MDWDAGPSGTWDLGPEFPTQYIWPGLPGIPRTRRQVANRKNVSKQSVSGTGLGHQRLEDAIFYRIAFWGSQNSWDPERDQPDPGPGPGPRPGPAGPGPGSRTQDPDPDPDWDPGPGSGPRCRRFPRDSVADQALAETSSTFMPARSPTVTCKLSLLFGILSRGSGSR